MEILRARGLTSTSSPPKSRKKGHPEPPCVPDIVSRTFDLVTSKGVLPYYALALWYSFVYAPYAQTTPGPRPTDYVIFKVLPIVYLMELVRHPPEAVCPYHDHARRYVIFGLSLTGVGDGLLAHRPDYLIYWAGLSALGYICYIMAFYQYYRPNKWAKLTIPLAFIKTSVLLLLVRSSGIVLALIAGYSVFITLLHFLAFVRLETCRTGPSYLGWAGVLLFIMADSFLATNLFVPVLGFRISDTIIAMTYYFGQLGIALSTYTIKLCPEPTSADSSATSVTSSASGAAFD